MGKLESWSLNNASQWSNHFNSLLPLLHLLFIHNGFTEWWSTYPLQTGTSSSWCSAFTLQTKHKVRPRFFLMHKAVKTYLWFTVYILSGFAFQQLVRLSDHLFKLLLFAEHLSLSPPFHYPSVFLSRPIRSISRWMCYDAWTHIIPLEPSSDRCVTAPREKILTLHLAKKDKCRYFYSHCQDRLYSEGRGGCLFIGLAHVHHEYKWMKSNA